MTAPARWRSRASPSAKRIAQQGGPEDSGDSRIDCPEYDAHPNLWEPSPPAVRSDLSSGALRLTADMAAALRDREAKQLDTLAQLGQSPNLLKRARARYMSTPLAVSLAELRSPLEKAYRSTVYCCATLDQADGKLKSRNGYCGQRWCLVCNRIRTARAWNRYMPVLDAWPDKHFVTLTIKNVPAAELRQAIKDMVSEFQAIKLGMRRTAGVKLRALRKLECTYNERTDEYHPHFHFIVEDREQALLLLEAWLDRHPDTTNAKGQNVKPADADSVRELFKYFTKLLAKKRRRDGRMVSVPVPPAALDVMFLAMKGRRVFQPAGFKVASKTPDENAEIKPDEATSALTRPDETLTWEWSQGAADWVDDSTGECLTGYDPATRFKEFVSKMCQPHASDVAGFDSGP